jgi:hypothetical protein
MQVQTAESSLDLELYTQGQVFNYSVVLPANLRLIDLLNGSVGIAKSFKGEFLELQNIEFDSKTDYCPGNKNVYIQKSAIYFIALSEVGLARGIGTNGKGAGYPYVAKMAKSVTIQCFGYYLIGTCI